MSDKIKRINLRSSLQTETLARDIIAFGDEGARHIQNTGIERDGGVRNLLIVSDNDTTYDETYYCSNGNKARIAYDDQNGFYRAYADGQEVGRFPSWGLASRVDFDISCDDAYVAPDGKIITATYNNPNVEIKEYSASGEFLRSKIVFIGFGSGFFRAFLVKKAGLDYDNIGHVGVVIQSGSYYPSIYTISGILVFNGFSSIVSFQVYNSISFWEDNGGFVIAAEGVGSGEPHIYLINSNGTVFNRTGGVTGSNSQFLTVYKRGSNLQFSSLFSEEPIPAPSPDRNYGFTFYYTTSWQVTSLSTGQPLSYNFSHLTPTMGGIAYTISDGINTESAYADPINATPTGNDGTLGGNPEVVGHIDSLSDLSLKVHTINSVAAYVSASWTFGAIGSVVSEIGELNPFIAPRLIEKPDGDAIIFYAKSSGGYVVVTMSKTITTRLQEIAPGVVKINTVSGQSIINTNKKTLEWDYSAYNGAGIFAYSPSTPSNKFVVARGETQYTNSVDTGSRIVNAGAYIQSVIYELNTYFSPGVPGIDLYRENTYRETYTTPLGFYRDNELRNTAYVPNNRIPPPLGALIGEKTITLSDSTAIRDDDYLGYQIANEILGDYIAFTLYAQLYLFDGERIFLATLVNGVITSRQEIAVATGLRFLAVSPTVAYFVSSYDNSIFTFDGGRSVNKILRMSQKANILAGVYNTKGNELALYGTNCDPIVWIRDGVITENVSPFCDLAGDIRTFSTKDGIWFVVHGFAVRYAYQAPTFPTDIIDCGDYPDIIDCGDYPDIINCGSLEQEGAIVPLVLQTAFFGADNNNLVTTNQYQIRLFSVDKGLETVDVLYYAFDQDKTWTQSLQFTIGDVNNPWDANGYAYIKFSPERPRALGGSIQIQTDSRMVILEINAYVAESDRNVPNNKG